MWSFYFEVALTAVAAASRGWATSQPCIAHHKVQVLQLVVAIIAFCFSGFVMPPISPWRRACSTFSNFLMMMGCFLLAVLNSTSQEVVQKLALASGFVATGSSIVLFGYRRIVLPLRKMQIAAKGSRADATELNNLTGEVDLAELLMALPSMDDGQVAPANGTAGGGISGGLNRGRMFNNNDAFDTTEMSEMLLFPTENNNNSSNNNNNIDIDIDVNNLFDDDENNNINNVLNNNNNSNNHSNYNSEEINLDVEDVWNFGEEEINHHNDNNNQNLDAELSSFFETK